MIGIGLGNFLLHREVSAGTGATSLFNVITFTINLTLSSKNMDKE